MTKPTPQQIKQARIDAGLTQSAAAALIRQTTRAWQQYEAGDREISLTAWELFLINTKKQLLHN